VCAGWLEVKERRWVDAEKMNERRGQRGINERKVRRKE
jgi:hypothetical protein